MNKLDIKKTLLSVAVLVGCCATATGCAATNKVAYVRERGDALAPRSVGEVEVLLDREPSKEFVVTGHFVAHGASSDRSIARIASEAKAAGLDGVYWIDCDTTFNGECSAKGFVYRDPRVVFDDQCPFHVPLHGSPRGRRSGARPALPLPVSTRASTDTRAAVRPRLRIGCPPRCSVHRSDAWSKVLASREHSAFFWGASRPDEQRLRKSRNARWPVAR